MFTSSVTEHLLMNEGIHSFVHSSNDYLVNPYFESDPRYWDILMNKQDKDISLPQRIYSSVRKKAGKKKASL